MIASTKTNSIRQNSSWQYKDNISHGNLWDACSSHTNIASYKLHPTLSESASYSPCRIAKFHSDYIIVIKWRWMVLSCGQIQELYWIINFIERRWLITALFLPYRFHNSREQYCILRVWAIRVPKVSNFAHIVIFWFATFNSIRFFPSQLSLASLPRGQVTIIKLTKSFAFFNQISRVDSMSEVHRMKYNCISMRSSTRIIKGDIVRAATKFDRFCFTKRWLVHWISGRMMQTDELITRCDKIFEKYNHTRRAVEPSMCA